PVGPVPPVAPVVPVTPVAPLGPLAPIPPTPVAPVGPRIPVAPVPPSAPVGPVDPLGPVGPVAPVAPCVPLGPLIPVVACWKVIVSLAALDGWLRLAKRIRAGPSAATATPWLLAGSITHCRTRFVTSHCTTRTRLPRMACTLPDDSGVVEMGGALRPVTVS